MSIVCIGDVHGKTHIYQKMLRQRFADKRSVQLGDMGIGFPGVGLHAMPLNHGWIRGNHDNAVLCRTKPNYLGDYGFISDGDGHSGMFIGGAYSIDRMFRTPGIDWWDDEELSYDQLKHLIALYEVTKPDFVLSHECPQEAGRILLLDLLDQYHVAKGDCCNSRTANAMQHMFEIHQPKEWVFGHYHVSKTFELKGTKFTCIPELETYEMVIT